MLSMYDVFAEDFTATIIVFLVLLIAIAYIVARKRSVSVFSGLLLVLVSLFSSPFVYLKKAILALADYRSNERTDVKQTRQYLLGKLLFALEALLVILSLVLLATGFVSGWNQLVPSKQLRESIGTLEDGLKKLNAELRETEPSVKEMENLWSTRRDSLIRAYNAERNHKAEIMIAQNSELANRISTSGDTAQQALNDIRSYHSQNEYLGEASLYEPVMSEIVSYVQRQNLSPELTTLLLNYNDNWYAQMLSRFDTQTLSEKQLGFAVFPAYHNRQQRLEVVKEMIPAQEKDLEQMRSEVRYNFEAFGLQIVLSLLEFVLFVWLVGLVIEWIGLGVDVAANVQKIQEHSAREK